MKASLIAIAIAISMQANAATDLAAHAWIHGAKDCTTNRDPAIEVLQFDAATYVLRQNKCVHAEAPFIYVLFGEHTVFVQDTGATEDAAAFPLHDTIQGLIAQRMARSPGQTLKILVTHSHSHRDHTAADSQFRGKPGVTLVEANAKAVRQFFGFTDWPAGLAKLELGGRTLEIVPAPGHQDGGIAVHDPRTGWLLTGDTLYPGRLYVKNWNEYRATIARLEAFSSTRAVSAVLGTHIEMSAAGTLFPAGSSFQPREASLVLGGEDLSTLHKALQKAGETPQDINLGKFVVAPISGLQRFVGSVLKWVGGL